MFTPTVYIGAIFVWSVIYMWVIQRPAFMLHNAATSDRAPRWKDIRNIYRHGSVTDMIVAAYLTALPTLIAWVAYDVKGFDPSIVLTVYGCIVSVAVGMLTVGDAGLYNFWKSKIEVSVLSYLKKPKIAFASVSGLYIAAGIAAILLASAVYFIPFLLISKGLTSSLTEPLATWQVIVGNLQFVVVIGLLFIAIRGLRVRPNNPTVSFYCQTPFFNHSALNGIYNFIYSASLKDRYTGHFRYFDDKECDKEFARMFPVKGETVTRIVDKKNPNVLVIIWESLSARFVEALGGTPDVTPNLNRIAAEGVLFTHCNCGSFLTDRGLVCTLSGIPGQPTTTIVMYTNKLPKLPGLPKTLREAGYTTEVVHGGDMSMRHIADYFISSGHERLVGPEAFPSSAPHCRWGVHDEATFSYLLDDIAEKDRRGERWYITLLTLSSHEAFDVPYARIGSKMENSFAYTDECLGRFIDTLKETPSWENMLVVIVGDHGVHHSADYGRQLPRHEYPHIPLVITGGAARQGIRIDTVMAQTDLPAILLGQMGLPHEDFTFSRDVLADTYTDPFSFHSFQNGFVVTTPEGYTVYDNDTDSVADGENPHREHYGKIIQQHLYKYLADL